VSNDCVAPFLRGVISTLRQFCRPGGHRWRQRSIRAPGIAGSRAASQPASGAATAPLWRCRSAATGRFPAGATRLGSGSRHAARKGLDCHHSWTQLPVPWITRPITLPPQTLPGPGGLSPEPASGAPAAGGNRPRPGWARPAGERPSCPRPAPSSWCRQELHQPAGRGPWNRQIPRAGLPLASVARPDDLPARPGGGRCRRPEAGGGCVQRRCPSFRPSPAARKARAAATIRSLAWPSPKGLWARAMA